MRKNFTELFRYLLTENATPAGLATSAAAGLFLGALPIMGFHIAAVLYVSLRLNLNLVVSLSIQNLCIPPFVPALCILAGYYLRTGDWLREYSFSSIFNMNRLLEWLLGSLIIAPLLAAAGFALVFVMVRFFKTRHS